MIETALIHVCFCIMCGVCCWDEYRV